MPLGRKNARDRGVERWCSEFVQRNALIVPHGQSAVRIHVRTSAAARHVVVVASKTAVGFVVVIAKIPSARATRPTEAHANVLSPRSKVKTIVVRRLYAQRDARVLSAVCVHTHIHVALQYVTSA